MNPGTRARTQCQIKQQTDLPFTKNSRVQLLVMVFSILVLSALPSGANDDFNSLLDRGTDLAQAKDYAKAIICYEKALKLNPRDPICNFDTAQAYNKLKDFTKARFYYQKTVEYDPKMGEAWSQLAGICIELKDFPAAEIAQKRACEFKPCCNYFDNLAKIYIQLGQLKEARSCLVKASAYPEAKLPENRDIAEDLKWVDQHLQIKKTGD